MVVHVLQDEMSILRRRLEKSEKERNELRQTADNLETKVCACAYVFVHAYVCMYMPLPTAIYTI